MWLHFWREITRKPPQSCTAQRRAKSHCDFEGRWHHRNLHILRAPTSLNCIWVPWTRRINYWYRLWLHHFTKAPRDYFHMLLRFSQVGLWSQISQKARHNARRRTRIVKTNVEKRKITKNTVTTVRNHSIRIAKRGRRNKARRVTGWSDWLRPSLQSEFQEYPPTIRSQLQLSDR